MSEVNILKFKNIEEVSRNIYVKFIHLYKQSIEKNGIFRVVLSGGKTPLNLYLFILSEESKKKIDWKKVHIFFGDERCVPEDHEESNFKMANDALLSKIDIPKANIHRIAGEKKLEAAPLYEDVIKENFLTDATSFDLILLGIGADGHTASIFPGSEILSDEKKLVQAVYVDSLGKYRISFTPRLINMAKNIIFMVTGEKKSKVLKEVIEGEFKPEIFPSQIVRECSGNVYWYLDFAASSMLSIG